MYTRPGWYSLGPRPAAPHGPAVEEHQWAGEGGVLGRHRVQTEHVVDSACARGLHTRMARRRCVYGYVRAV